MSGGTFTISCVAAITRSAHTRSNGGVFGSLFGTPVRWQIVRLALTLADHQHAADGCAQAPGGAWLTCAQVLGLHAINDRPVAINGKMRCPHTDERAD